MKKTIAVYALYGKGEHACEFEDYRNEDKDWTILTEPQEVTFIERDHADVVLDKVGALEAKKTRLQAELGAKIAKVDDDIQKLMAIEYTPNESQEN